MIADPAVEVQVVEVQAVVARAVMAWADATAKVQHLIVVAATVVVIVMAAAWADEIVAITTAITTVEDMASVVEALGSGDQWDRAAVPTIPHVATMAALDSALTAAGNLLKEVLQIFSLR